MKKTVLTFGLISGTLSSLMMLATVPFMDKIGFDKGEIIGYTALVLSFLLVFFGIRSYRDNVANGTITFGRAFSIGLLITMISCVFYVVTWEFLYFNFLPDFVDQYTAHVVDQLKATGASPEAIQTRVEQMKQFKELYQNPVYNVLFTFIEPLPVGLLVTLLSAAMLRKKSAPGFRPSSRVTA